MVRRLKVEFLIPLKYNDGTNVDPNKLFIVKEKLIELFGGITIHHYYRRYMDRPKDTHKIFR